MKIKSHNEYDAKKQFKKNMQFQLNNEINNSWRRKYGYKINFPLNILAELFIILKDIGSEDIRRFDLSYYYGIDIYSIKPSVPIFIPYKGRIIKESFEGFLKANSDWLQLSDNIDKWFFDLSNLKKYNLNIK